MSKKTRKKSSKGSAKTPARKTATAKAARGGSKASAKTPAATPRKAVAKKPAKAAKTAVAKASHKPASKQLKSAPSAAPKPEAAPIPKPALKPVAAPVQKPESKPGPAVALVEGAKAPSFRLPRDGGESAALADYAGQKLVLFFYPRADTPGCTREAIDFTRLRDAFAEAGTAVLGVSADTVKAQESFRDKHQLSIPLISDEQHQMLEAYGAWGEKSMYGRTFLGILRTTVLIGANGKIAKIWRNVRVDGHADEVLAAAKAM
jgi:thioredoxin-dependent peroxiredoxin